jgi:hypothetical protein
LYQHILLVDDPVATSPNRLSVRRTRRMEGEIKLSPRGGSAVAIVLTGAGALLRRG